MMDPFGYSIFCDDIRVEIDQKLTFVGAYSAAMVVHGQFPATLPKLGFSITLFEPIELAKARTEEVIVNIYLPNDPDDKPTFTINLPPNPDQVELDERECANEDGPLLMIMNANLISAPLVIKGPGLIKVRALYGGKVIRLGSLKVKQQRNLVESSSNPS
jgi:hypothetical protein